MHRRPARTPGALGICKQKSCPSVDFFSHGHDALLVIVVPALPVHARSCFIVSPPADSLDPSVRVTYT